MAKKNDEFFEQARARFKQAEDSETKNREEALDDLRFSDGDQWPEPIRKAREADNRPVLTIDRVMPALRQITNDVRQNRPAVQINPVDDEGDVDTAEIYQGLIRHIEEYSSADVAWDSAADYAARMGFAYVRVLTEWCDYDSFDQEIIIEAVENPFNVYIDPNAIKLDRRDMRWGFILEDYTKEAYKREFPKSEVASLLDFEGGLGARAPEWIEADKVRIAEYFYIEDEEHLIALLQDGRVAPAADVPEGTLIVRTRKSYIPHVRWCKMNGIEVLDEREWPGKYVPIIPVYGEMININGQRKYRGMVRGAKDAQRAFNYWVSAETELIGLAPKSPWVAAEGQIEGYEELYRQANIRNIAVLPYKPKALGSLLVPAPQRQSVEPPIQAISMARAQAIDDVKAVTGIFDASLGNRSNETSGKAILARQKEGDVSNFHFSDNLARSIKHCGRILIDLIPKIYNQPRVVRIIGKDDDHKTVQLNQPFQESPGVSKIYDMTAGKYDVTVSVGPSYTSKRQEAVQSMMALVSSYPQLMQICGDLLVKNFDWPGAAGIAERIKKTLPPQLQDDEQQQQPLPPQVKAKMDQMGQMVDMLSQQLQALTEEQKSNKVQVDSKERIEMAKLEVQREEIKVKAEVEMAKLGSQEDIARLENDLDRLKHSLEIYSDAASQEASQEHEMNLAQMQQGADQDSQAQDQAHEVGMTAMGQGHEAELAGADREHQAGMQQNQLASQQALAARQLQAQQQQGGQGA